MSDVSTQYRSNMNASAVDLRGSLHEYIIHRTWLDDWQVLAAIRTNCVRVNGIVTNESGLVIVRKWTIEIEYDAFVCETWENGRREEIREIVSHTWEVE